MKTYDINGNLHIYERHERCVSSSRTGFDRMTEAELLQNLAAAITRRDQLDNAIEDMRGLLLDEAVAMRLGVEE